MDIVCFITTERGNDLIVSFAVQKPGEQTEIESLTLLCSPKYDLLLPPEERGVSVTFERFDDGGEPDMLEEVRFSARDKIVEIVAGPRRYRLDVRKVDPEELSEMCRVFRKMGHEGRRIRLIGV